MESHYTNMHKDAVLKTCEFCGGSFKRLDKHIERNMCQTDNQVRFDCESCDKTFSMKHSLANHIKVVHLKIRNKACTYCDYKTHTKFNLDLHINKMHHGIRKTKQGCIHCGKSTYKMDHHIKVYHGESV